MPLERAFRYARRLLLSAAGRAYLRAVALPRLHSRGVLGDGPADVSYGNGHAVIAGRERLLKVRLDRRSTIALEHANRMAAVAKWPALDALLAECRFEDSAPAFLAMPRYTPLGLEAGVACAARVWHVMQGCRSGARTLALAESPQLLAGLTVLAGLYGDATATRVRRRVEAFLASGDYHLGFAHGDFHSRNIMLDERGASRLLDLDCLRLNGVQEMDALYFVLEWEWSRSGALWQRTLAELPRRSDLQAMLQSTFGVAAGEGLAATCLVDRIGQEESTFGILSRRAILDAAVKEIA